MTHIPYGTYRFYRLIRCYQCVTVLFIDGSTSTQTLCVPAGFGRVSTTCCPRYLPFAQLIRLFVSRLKNLCRYYVLCLVLVGFNLYTCSRLNTIDQLGKSSSEEAEYRGLLSKWFHSFNHIYWSPSHMHSSTSKSIMMKGWCTSFSPYFTCFFFRCECLKSLIFLRRRVSASTPHTKRQEEEEEAFSRNVLDFSILHRLKAKEENLSCQDETSS